MRVWIAALVVLALILFAAPIAGAQDDNIPVTPVRTLALGMAMLTMTLVCALSLFMLSGWDEQHRRLR